MIICGYYINFFLIIFLTVFTIRNILEIIIVPKPTLKGRGHISLLLFTLLYFIVGISVASYLFKANSVNIIVFYLGVFLFLTFHVIRLFAIKKMGKSYSQYITPNSNGSLMNKGIYSKIRHPLYLFYFIELCGMLLIKFNYIALCAVIFDIIVTLFRIKEEEKLLIEKYGEAYIAYKTKTWKLIPNIC